MLLPALPTDSHKDANCTLPLITSPLSPQAYVVLLSALLTLLPLENAEGPDAEADERLLRELAAAKDLDAKIGELAQGVAVWFASSLFMQNTAMGGPTPTSTCLLFCDSRPFLSVILSNPAGNGGSAEDQHWAVLKLAWGVLLSQYGPESAAGETCCAVLCYAALDCAALRWTHIACQVGCATQLATIAGRTCAASLQSVRGRWSARLPRQVPWPS